MALIQTRTVREALLYVAAKRDWSGGTPLDSPIWEIVARRLFEIANNPDTRVVGSVNKAVRAQRIILDRTTGTRRAGSHPAQRKQNQIKFRDLTGGGSNE